MSFGPELVWYWSELLKRYTGHRMFKIEGGDSWLLLGFSGGLPDLLVSWNAQYNGIASVSGEERKKLLASVRQLPPITNILKSQLTAAELTSVRQLNRDKIVEFTFAKTVGAGFVTTRYLLFEIMERYSNVILLDEQRNVVEAAKHIHPSENRYRSVLPWQPYTEPPKFKGISLETWLEDPDKTELFDIAGFGRKFLYAIEDRATDELVSLLKCYFKDATCMKPQLTGGKYVTIATEALNDTSCMLYDYRMGKDELLMPLLSRDLEAERKKVTAKIKHELTRRERQLTDIMNLLNGQDAAEFKQKADLITANLWQIKGQADKATFMAYNDDGEKSEVTIELDPALTPAKNAERLYAKYKKVTAAQRRAAELLCKVQSEISEFSEQLALAEQIDNAEELEALGQEVGLQKSSRKKKKETDKLPPHKRFDFDFAIVVAGLSAKGNRYATFKFANPEDLWFHAQGVPGSHVILRRTREVTAEEKAFAEKFCASLAVAFCKTAVYGLRVDYCERKFVTAIPGQVANVTYREFQSIDGDPFWWSEQNIKNDMRHKRKGE